MPWIPSLMLVDDDPRVLESLIPSLPNELAKALTVSRFASRITSGEPDAMHARPLGVRVTAHGYPSTRVPIYRQPSPHHLHLHLVCDPDGQFRTARALLNQHLFAVVVSDLRFSDEGSGLRAGKLFVEEVERIQPESRGILYSAYPAPPDFPPDRFIRKTAGTDGPTLVPTIVQALESHLARPEVDALARSVADEGLIYQSDTFNAVLSQCYSLGNLIGQESDSRPSARRSRRPLPCVLLDGESGTGKRGLAAVIHAVSPRRSQPLLVATCSDLTNETLLRSILFGHKRGAFTDAREDRVGLVASAGRGVLVLDDFHRLPTACASILHSFLEDGIFSRVGEEEVRRHAECLIIATVETQPWRERRRSGELSMAFLARVERFPILVPPLRERPDDIVAQTRHLARSLAAELKVEMEIDEALLQRLRLQPFADSNSRELRNVIENAIYRNHKQTDTLAWEHVEPWLARTEPATPPSATSPTSGSGSAPSNPPRNDWQERLVALATRRLAQATEFNEAESRAAIERLFTIQLPDLWAQFETLRTLEPGKPPIPMSLWDDVWRCFAVYYLGGPTPAERVLGIPANTLRQWINDREARQSSPRSDHSG